MRIDLTITNPKTGTSKVIAVAGYTCEELKKTYDIYIAAGYSASITHIGRGV